VASVFKPHHLHTKPTIGEWVSFRGASSNQNKSRGEIARAVCTALRSDRNSYWTPDRASAPDIRRIGVQGAVLSQMWIVLPRHQRYLGCMIQEHSRSATVWKTAASPLMERSLGPTPCMSPLHHQTPAKYCKMKEHFGTRQCAALGPDSPGNVTELRHIEGKSWTQRSPEVIVRKRSRLALQLRSLWISEDHRSMSLDLLKFLAVRPTVLKRIMSTHLTPHLQ
jgi:hypothetical protein